MTPDAPKDPMTEAEDEKPATEPAPIAAAPAELICSFCGATQAKSIMMVSSGRPNGAVICDLCIENGQVLVNKRARESQAAFLKEQAFEAEVQKRLEQAQAARVGKAGATVQDVLAATAAPDVPGIEGAPV